MSRFARFCAAALLTAAAALPGRAATEVQVVTSPGGIEAWLVEEPSIPMLALEIRFRTGDAGEAEALTGVTSFMASLLDEGAGELDAAAFEAAADRLALRMGFSSSVESFAVSARMLSEKRGDSLALLKSALSAPRFDVAAVERVRARLLASIRSRATDDGWLASNAWRSALMPGHPFARTSSEATIAAVTAEDLEAARRVALNRRDVVVTAVGDITAEELGPILDELLGDLPEGPLPDVPAPQLSQDRGVVVVDLDVPQSTVRMVQEGIGREDPDFFAAHVMNRILGGGGFSSRLTVEVRQKRGLTYSVGSGLGGFETAPLIFASFATSNDRVAEAMAVVRAEWERMAEGGATVEELEAAKAYMTGAYPLRFDSNAKIAGLLAAVKQDDLDPGYIARRNGYIEAVTVQDVARVAARLLDAERLLTVVVGRPEGVETTLDGS